MGCTAGGVVSYAVARAAFGTEQGQIRDWGDMRLSGFAGLAYDREPDGVDKCTRRSKNGAMTNTSTTPLLVILGGHQTPNRGSDAVGDSFGPQPTLALQVGLSMAVWGSDLQPRKSHSTGKRTRPTDLLGPQSPCQGRRPLQYRRGYCGQCVLGERKPMLRGCMD